MDWKRVARIALTSFEWVGVVVFGLILAAFVGLWILLGWVGREPEAMGGAELAVADPLDAQVDARVDAQVDARAPEPGSTPSAASHAPAPTPVEASSLFAPIHQVLVSPRCMNCHPDGDRPLAQNGGAHAMNISRASPEAGLTCSTCHAEHNSKVPGGPPGAPHWGLPPADTPMIFEGRSVTALCEQLRDLDHNGQRSLAELLHHVEHDPLVLWGWDAGGDRQAPPISHPEFVASVSAWVDAGGICPGETVPPVLDGEPAGDEPEGSPAAAE